MGKLRLPDPLTPRHYREPCPRLQKQATSAHFTSNTWSYRSTSALLYSLILPNSISHSTSVWCLPVNSFISVFSARQLRWELRTWPWNYSPMAFTCQTRKQQFQQIWPLFFDGHVCFELQQVGEALTRYSNNCGTSPYFLSLNVFEKPVGFMGGSSKWHVELISLQHTPPPSPPLT